ncbi:DUF1707 SHOCT-like domain-containing protein [Tessaracoccus caeni]|uniref:DUF1707 SHOCT-like domain-containing protein n=1 Tax=Tessaracoccus caeni TaxID=3031239 RepID=UPI0023DB628C|nr:DUF1707 domain-containing protein [Tessaracoccus caeni]MDF1486959.1 DUF1707 domain-containing protein [Tessaracoccus caeni]
MIQLPPSSKYRAQADAAVDDAEREALTSRLNDAFERGDLTQERYLENLDIVYAATTLGDLIPVVEQLPGPVASTPAIVESQSAPPGVVKQGRSVVMPAVVIGVGAVALLMVLSVLIAVLMFL